MRRIFYIQSQVTIVYNIEEKWVKNTLPSPDNNDLDSCWTAGKSCGFENNSSGAKQSTCEMIVAMSSRGK